MRRSCRDWTEIAAEIEEMRQRANLAAEEQLRDAYCCPLSLEPLEDPVCAILRNRSPTAMAAKWVELGGKVEPAAAAAPVPPRNLAARAHEH